MKKILILFITTILFSADVLAITRATSSKQTEALKYDVYYHWGIIWKKAGSGVLNLFEETTDDGSVRMHSKLTGKSLSFIEYIMAVRDTLESWYSPDLVPIEYVKKTNEGSYKAVERNYYSYTLKEGKDLTPDNVDSVKVELRRWRAKKGNDAQNFAVAGVAHDMLSSFYFVRALDFDNLKPGTIIKFPLFAGIKMQGMSVKFVGKETCKMRDGRKIPAYKAEMAINTKGEDGAPLEVWFSTDKSHKPMNVIIRLKRVGAIQCEIVK